MENFEQATAESFAITLMLGLLFARSTDAMTRLDALCADELCVREILGARRAKSKEFIDRVLETLEAVRQAASDARTAQ